MVPHQESWSVRINTTMLNIMVVIVRAVLRSLVLNRRKGNHLLLLTIRLAGKYQ